MSMIAVFGFSQENPGSWCGTQDLLEQRINGDQKVRDQIHEDMMQASSFNENKDVQALKTIPCVFHILHDNGVGNISDEQVQSALDVLNRDFNRLNADTVNTRDTPQAPFKQFAGSMEMEFKLARIDPNGNCTNGILRKNVASNATYEVNMNSEPHKYTSSGGSSAWPRANYFNIWIVNSIGASGQGIILGYAQFPQSWGGSAATYGITMRHDQTGTLGTAIGNDGRTFTHEVGHCFGLFHSFTDQVGCGTNCSNSGDYCCDTPPQYDAYYNCDFNLNSCTNIPNNDAYGSDVLDQIENYMSYNSCQNMFTYDQANIMDNNFSTLGYLGTLGSLANAAATGINVPDALCQAEFDSDKKTICAGESVQFTDGTFNAANSWNWTFQGGTPAGSSDQDPVVTYNTPGLYEVTLLASDGTNNDTETKTDYILVLPSTGDPLPIFDGFETYTAFNAETDWSVDNPGGNAKFEVTNTTGLGSAQSAKLANFGQAAGNVDELISSPVDLSSISSATNMTLSFRYAYHQRNSNNDEWLKVFATNDCGETWVQRKTIHGTFLGDQVSTSAWTPSSNSDWTTVHMTNITSSYWVSNFRYKFRFESDNGNNFYLDNINIYAGGPSDAIVVGLEEGDVFADLNVYPNPTDSDLNVEFSVGNAQKVTLAIKDVAGKIVQTNIVQTNAGRNVVMLDTNPLAGGMYFLDIISGGKQQTIQFVVK
jgi:PKD repeat protein